ncbi:MAG: hypothetical protein RMK73_02870 [Geminicoccaceae bacterium]|nr:hypothetical protein [Geminicoccaceae bacterium]MDW8340406.1 hypothetical protein [Geminicoccaceae bacterium]
MIPHRHGFGFPFLLASLLAACATAPPTPPRFGREPVERNYLPPADPPPPVPVIATAVPPEAAIARLAEALGAEKSRMRRGTAEDGTAWLELTSSGDPEPFVDCGSFELHEPGAPPRRIPAARLDLRIPLAPPERREVLLRQLRLDGRLLAIARPSEPGSRLEVRATYVLTRTVDRVALDGRVLDTQRETAAFETGTTGRFAQGLVCRPSGRLEQAVVRAAEQLLNPADASAGAPR